MRRTFVSLAKLKLVLPYLLIGSFVTTFLLSLTKDEKYIQNHMYQSPSGFWGRYRGHKPRTRSASDYQSIEAMMSQMLELRRKLERATPGPSPLELGVKDGQTPKPSTTRNTLYTLALATTTARFNGEKFTFDPLPFEPVMSAKERLAMFAALLKIRSVSEENGFIWMIYSGTLLGSWRHHDMIPWDDDVDILMSLKQKDSIIAAFKKLSPEFEFHKTPSRLKFWATNGTQKTNSFQWNWPYIDISFFAENSSHVWDASTLSDYGDNFYIVDKSIVFPLHLRALGMYFFPAPRDTWMHLARTYRISGASTCQSTFYSHITEKVKKPHEIPCKYLKDRYPFVHRRISDNGKGIVESLQFRGEVFYSIYVDEPAYAVTDPYDSLIFHL